MPIKRATQAFLWKLTVSTFKATYGRYPDKSGDKTWTKNYIQVPSEVRDKLNAVLGHSGVPGNEVEIKWVWPGGEQTARYDNKDSGGDNRGQLYITEKTGANKVVLPPFVPGDASDERKALIGDASLPTPADATALMNTIISSGIDAWYMAVALEGETGILHARMVLRNPPSGKEAFGIDRQPLQIREAIENAGSESSLWVDLEFKPRAAAVVRSIEDAFQRSPNVLLVGPPGCGKTIALEDLKAAYEEAAWFDPDLIDPWVKGEHKVFDTAFYPGLSYENFVAGLAPAPGRGIRLEVRSGPLMNLAQWCRGSDRQGLLVIDEFNRGPAAAIFGDMLVLLDKGKREASGQPGATISQPYPDRVITVPSEFAAKGPEGRRVPTSFSLPAGLRILGAFNSSDRSVAPLDAALLRRFALVRVGPDPAVLAHHLGLNDFDPKDLAYQAKPVNSWEAGDVRRLAVHLLIVLNERLRAILGEDHELGHALFWEVPSDAGREETAAILAAEFEEKIVGRLRVTLRDKDEQLAVILNAADLGETSVEGVADWIDDDSRVGRLVGAKLHIRNLKADPFDEQIKRLLVVVRPSP